MKKHKLKKKQYEHKPQSIRKKITKPQRNNGKKWKISFILSTCIKLKITVSLWLIL